MKIKKMTATFGKLEGAVLTPGEGLTLIQAPNEGGKSTWNAFLRAMLYGFPPRDRDKNGYLAEKNHYQPWSGAPMEGVLELEWQGREVTITRGPRGGLPWADFRAFYTATQEPVPGMTGDNCGQLLLGISREVFERTAFLLQDSGALTPSAELEKRVAALASTGDEIVSFTQVERRLKDWTNRRRANSRTGLIPQLEEELNQVVGRRMSLEELHRRAQEAQRRREDRERDCAALEGQLQSLAAGRRARAEAELDQARQQRDRLAAALSTTPDTQVLRQAQGEVSLLNSLRTEQVTLERELESLGELAAKTRQAARSDPYFKGMEGQEAGDRAERDNHEVKRLSRNRFGLLLPFLGLLLGAAAGFFLPFLGLVTLPPELQPWLTAIMGGAAGCLVLTLLSLIRRQLRRRKAWDILDRYDADCAEEIYDRVDNYDRLAAAAREQEDRQKAAEDRCAQLKQLQAEKTAQLLELVRPFAPEVTEPVGVAAALARALKLEESLGLAQARLEGAEQLLAALPAVQGAAQQDEVPEADEAQLRERLNTARSALVRARDEAARLSGELKAQGDPEELESRESALTEELDRRRRELAALEAAMGSLRHADSLLRERFSPVLNRRAGEYLSALTGGRYEAAALTRQFQALARETGQSVHRQDLSLSGGTAQQLYLALRLALCDLVLPEHEPCPIFLDDALDAFDDRRASLALDCLLEVAQRRQVLLFTCHSREGELLRGRPATLLRSV